MAYLSPPKTIGINYDKLTTSVTNLFLRESPWPNLSAGTISSAARDAANSTTTTLRAGLVLAQLTSGSELVEWGTNFVDITAETASGTGSAVTFDLAQDSIVPGSVTVTIGTVAQADDLYTVKYAQGEITFKTAPATGTDNISFAYTHMGTLDGSEIPVGVLAEETNLLNDAGSAADMAARYWISGYVDSSQLVFDNTNATDYGKFLLQHAQGLQFAGMTYSLRDFAVGSEDGA